MTEISRELCRRLSIPVLISGLTTIGPLHKLVRHKDYVSITLLCRGNLIELKFADDNTAEGEGYIVIDGEEPLAVGDVPICVGLRCGRDCGCGCIKDLGYVDSSPLFIAVKLEPTACHTIHETLPANMADPKLFNLVKTKASINELISTYIQAFIDASKRQ